MAILYWVCLAAVIGCGAGRQYEGPARPLDQIALLENASTGSVAGTTTTTGTIIVARVDRAELEISLSRGRPRWIELLPGLHHLSFVWFRERSSKATGASFLEGSVSFLAQTGRTYAIGADIDPQRSLLTNARVVETTDSWRGHRLHEQAAGKGR